MRERVGERVRERVRERAKERTSIMYHLQVSVLVYSMGLLSGPRPFTFKATTVIR